MKVDKLKDLYKELLVELTFLAKRIAKFANKGRSKGLDFKEGGIAYLLRRNIKTKRLSDKLDFKKLRLFKIKKKLGLVTYRLILPKDIRIYLVFYIVLLEKAPKGAKI